jgi:hypothetical protein
LKPELDNELGAEERGSGAAKHTRTESFSFSDSF